MSKDKLRVAILTGKDSRTTCESIEQIVSLPNVEVLGILLDTEQATLNRRLLNLRRNVRREGFSYLWFRLGDGLFDLVEGWAERIAPREEAMRLLRQAFPDRAFRLSDLTRLHGIPVFDVGNINGAKAIETLRGLQADLGVVLGTRILRRSIFSAPRLGSVNLHKGKVPEYRGQPAGFWEIFDSQRVAEVTVHFVDDGLDTGDVVGVAQVLIHAQDSPQTLRSKLDVSGAELLRTCLSQIAEGTAVRRPQPKADHKARTSPTRRERRAVEKRLGLASPRGLHVIKTLLYLAVYHLGIYGFIRARHAKSSGGRGCILLYHRVNDLSCDWLTASVEKFAEHLCTVRQRYSLVSTTQMVAKVKSSEHLPGSSVAIHFDDCYRDVYTNASRILAQLQVPACAFVSSGFVDTDRTFPHDLKRSPFSFENLNSGDITGLVKRGFEIGAHTVNHVDLGAVDAQEAAVELGQSKRDLEVIVGRPVNLVSYPYGKRSNIRPEVVELARRSGYEAMFSAYGGYVNGDANAFNIQRIGVSGQYRALDLLMTIEGISLEALKERWIGVKGKSAWA
jgi:peptidoglycan/xylan/chitin deacetylase (PgdA/CDA1 family)